MSRTESRLRWLGLMISALGIYGVGVLAFAANSNKKEKSEASTRSQIQDAVSQGLSMREALTLQSTNPWSFSAQASVFQSLDVYDEAYSRYGADVSYRLSKKESVAASLSLFRPTDGLDPDPIRYGLSDLRVSYFSPRWRRLKGGAILSASLGMTLPSSRRSRSESLLASSDMNLALRKPLTGKLKFLTLQGFTSVVGAVHRFETSDAFGTTFNSPLGLSVGAGANIRFFENFIFSQSFSLYARADYQNYWKWIETLSSTLTFVSGRQFNLFFQFRWRDEMITNDVFLDDDKSRVLGGLSYFF